MVFSKTVATAAALWGWLRPAPAQPVSRFSLYLPTEFALQPVAVTGGGRIAISPDGRRMVYVGPGEGSSRLWLRRLDQLTATPIPGTEEAVSPFFSPDGRQVGFVRGGRTIQVVSLEGAPPLTVTDEANTTGGDWGEDGYIYFEVDSGIARVRPSGGEIERVYTFVVARGEIATEWPAVLPGGSGVVFRARQGGKGIETFEIVAQKLPAGPARVLTRGVYARYARTGHLLVVTAEGKLIAIPFDPDKLELTGPPAALAEGIGVRVDGFNVDLVLSASGTLVYTTGGAIASRRAVWVTREGFATPVDPAWDPQGTINSLALSPDGKALAVGLTRNGKEDVWVKQLPAGPFSRVTFGDTASVRPAWTPDGRTLVYVNDRTGNGVGSIYTHRADGTGTPQLVLASRIDFGQAVYSRDGRWMLLRRTTSDSGNGDILGMRTGDPALVPLVTSPAREFFPAISPDGRWLAYSSNESGTPEIYVRPFPATTTARWQVSTTGGREPVWARSGRELFYINGRNEMVAAQIPSGPTFSVGEQRVLFDAGTYLRVGATHSFDVSPDDKRFVMLREGEPSQQSELILAENWIQELTARGRK